MKQILIYSALLMVMACGRGKKAALNAAVHDPSLEIERTVAGVQMRMAYLPACWQQHAGKGQADTSELVFHLRVFPPKSGKVNEQVASFGIDSLFVLAAGPDTLMPLYGERVATGNLGGFEYVVAFDRTAALRNTHSVLVFHDWLFTHAAIEFPYITDNIKNADALSCSL